MEPPLQSWSGVPQLPLQGLTIRAPRTRIAALSSASLFASGPSLPHGVEDDTRLRPGHEGRSLLLAGIELEETESSLALLPRMCSWGTACGSSSARTIASSVLSPMGSLRARSLWRPMALRSPGSSSRDHEFTRSHLADERPGLASPVFPLRSPGGPGRLRMSSAMSAASLPAPLGLPPVRVSRRNSQQPAGAALFTLEPSRAETTLSSMPSPFNSHAFLPLNDWSPVAPPQTNSFGKRNGSPVPCESPPRRVCSSHEPDHFGFLSGPQPRDEPVPAPAMLMWPPAIPIAVPPRPGAIAAAASPPQQANLAAGPCALDLTLHDDRVTMTTCSPATMATGEELFLDSDPPSGTLEDDELLVSLRHTLRPCASEPVWLDCGTTQANDVQPRWGMANVGEDRDEMGLVHALHMQWIDWNDHATPATMEGEHNKAPRP